MKEDMSSLYLHLWRSRSLYQTLASSLAVVRRFPTVVSLRESLRARARSTRPLDQSSKRSSYSSPRRTRLCRLACSHRSLSVFGIPSRPCSFHIVILRSTEVISYITLLYAFSFRKRGLQSLTCRWVNVMLANLSAALMTAETFLYHLSAAAAVRVHCPVELGDTGG